MMIASNVESLDLVMNHGRIPNVIHPTLLWDEEQVILVDTGMPGHLDEIRAAFASAGIPLDKLTKVILTHQDFDHIGGLSDILSVVDGIEVMAHEVEKPYIEGEKPLIKLRSYKPGPKVRVDTTLSGQQVLPYCEGIRVIFTPGHTPGHISLYIQGSKTLIAGDAMIAKNGKLYGPNKQFTPDMDSAMQSIGKFLDYDIETVICYHGGEVTKNIRPQIHDVIKLYKM